MVRLLLVLLLTAAAGPALGQDGAGYPDGCERFIRGKSFVLNPDQHDVVPEEEMLAVGPCMEAWFRIHFPEAVFETAEESPDPATRALVACAPRDFEAAVACLRRHLPEPIREDLLAEGGTVNAHFGLGMFLRNNWGLWDERSPLHRGLAALGFLHPDDMSAAILDAYVAAETGRAFDMQAELDRYRDYWREADTYRDVPLEECLGPDPRAHEGVESCSINEQGVMRMTVREMREVPDAD